MFIYLWNHSFLTAQLPHGEQMESCVAWKAFFCVVLLHVPRQEPLIQRDGGPSLQFMALQTDEKGFGISVLS